MGFESFFLYTLTSTLADLRFPAGRPLSQPQISWTQVTASKKIPCGLVLGLEYKNPGDPTGQSLPSSLEPLFIHG